MWSQKTLPVNITSTKVDIQGNHIARITFLKLFHFDLAHITVCMLNLVDIGI